MVLGLPLVADIRRAMPAPYALPRGRGDLDVPGQQRADAGVAEIAELPVRHAECLDGGVPDAVAVVVAVDRVGLARSLVSTFARVYSRAVASETSRSAAISRSSLARCTLAAGS